MRERTRGRAGVLLAVLLLLLLAGCGAEEGAVTEITFIHGWGSTEADHAAMRRIYQDFERDNPDIKLNMLSMPTSDEVVRRAEDMIMVGSIPDVIFLGGLGIDTIYRYMVDSGRALDLMPYIQADEGFRASLAPANLEYWTTGDGRLYSISDVLILGGGYWYNREILAQAGVTEPPATWEEFEAACARIQAWAAAEGNGVQAMQLSAEGYLYFMDHILADSGGTILEGQLPTAAEELEPAFSILRRLYTYSVGEGGGYTYRDETSLFNAGELAIYVNGVWGSSMIEEGIDAAYALLPSEGGGVCCESAGAGYVLGSTGDAARQEASLRFLKYMLSREVQERILLETQQLPANPTITIADYAARMPRFCQAVATAQRAEVKIQIPDQLWSNRQTSTFQTHIFDALSGDLHRQTFCDMLR